jgi:hypothetical protein
MNLLDRWALRRTEKFHKKQKLREEIGLQPDCNIKVPYTLNGSMAINKVHRSKADFSRERAMEFTLHPAEGGFILEYNHYDSKNDRHTQRLHIINDSDDMGDAISKILTVELIRR